MNETNKSFIYSLKSKKLNKKLVIPLFIGLLFTLSLLGITQYSSAQNTQKAQDSFTLATKLFNESRLASTVFAKLVHASTVFTRFWVS